MQQDYDVIIVGAGVSGTALYYVLANYSDVKRVAIFEKHKQVAQVASHPTQNSQTLHFGDIETNYALEKAQEVSKGARLVQNYLERVAPKKTFSKSHKMVIGVGPKEARRLRRRYEKFKELFPKSKLLEADEIARIEPEVMRGRDKKQEIVAIYSPEGYMVDYHRLSKSFHEQVKSAKLTRRDFDEFFGTEITDITRHNEGYAVTTADAKTYTCKQLVVNSGAMSIKFAKKLGYAKDLSILSVAGNFYRGPEVLKGKVYTMQKEKLPFAAVHGDPDVNEKGYTRYGPSAKPLLMLERWNYETVKDYFLVAEWTLDGFKTLLNILFDKTYFPYMVKNMLYDVPVIGERLFARNVKKIIPLADPAEIRKDPGYGGARPQIVNLKKRKISMGEARIEEKNAIFNITPSPGASTCLANAKRDAQILVKGLGKRFFEKKFEKDLV